jgi:RNA polymerase sigma-70 factor, ECF subfamily
MFFKNNHSSFEAMVEAHSGDIYRFAYWLCRDKSVAEDLVQETFARAWANWEQVRDEKAAKGWLLTICHHEHARLYEKKRVEIDDQELDEMMHAVESKIEASYEMREALGMLPLPYREPLLLQVLGGFSCAEIGEMVGVSEATAMQRVTRARKAMREIFEKPEMGWGMKS